MSKNAIYILDSSGKIAHMFVSETGFIVSPRNLSDSSLVEQIDNTYTFISQDTTVPIQIFNVSDQCTPDQTVLSECLNKTVIVDVTQSFSGNVLYLLIPEISLTKYSVAPDTYITMNEEGQIIVQVSPGFEPEITDLSSTATTETRVEPDTSSTQVEPDTSSTQVEPDTSIVSESSEHEHEIITAFNIAKGIAESIGQSNSSNSTATTESMTPSVLSSLNPWSKFG